MRLATCAAALTAPLAAQVPRYDPAQLRGAVFTEELRTDVHTASGTAERSRSIIRNVTYSLTQAHDTIVVTADTAWLHENAAGDDRLINVDAVIGGRWFLLITPGGTVSVEDQPVITRDIADVSDFRTAMDDFFPLAPPPLAPRETVTDSSRRTWRRLADSAGVQRYHLQHHDMNNTSRTLTDTLSVRSEEEVTEESDIAWDAARGPVRWTRHLTSVVTSRYAGRTMRASAEQRVTVRRLR